MSLTDEDKDWIRTELSTLKDSVKADLSTLRDSGKAELSTLRDSVNADLATLKDSIERVETSLLTEFHKWSSPLEMRVKSHALAIRALDLEVDAIAERVTKLEPRQ